MTKRPRTKKSRHEQQEYSKRLDSTILALREQRFSNVQIAQRLDITKDSVSHRLAKLRQNGINVPIAPRFRGQPPPPPLFRCRLCNIPMREPAEGVCGFCIEEAQVIGVEEEEVKALARDRMALVCSG